MKKSPVLLTWIFLTTFVLSWGQNSVAFTDGIKIGKAAAPGFLALQQHFHRYVDEGQLAGMVMLVSRGGEVLKDVYGMQNIAAGVPMSEHTIFRLASMTKPVVSVAVMQLVEAGKLHLDDPVKKYIPAFGKQQVYISENKTEPPKRAVTVQDLLSHTGGISSGYDPSPVGKICLAAMRGKQPGSLQDMADVLAAVPLSFQPGEGWVYSYGVDILAYIVEQVSGEPLDEYLEKNIFKPLKMSDTGYSVPTGKLDRFAALYKTGDDGKLVLAEAPRDSPYVTGDKFPRGSNGLVSTPGDYLRFAKMLLNGGELDGAHILKKETLAQMTSNILPDNLTPIKIGNIPLAGQGFGLGFGVLLDSPPFGSPGDFFWPGAHFTYFFVSPSENMVGIFMTQLSDMSKLHLIGEFHGLAGGVFSQ